MIDWETIWTFIGIDTVVHLIVGAIFLPLGARFVEWYAVKNYGSLFKKDVK